MHFAVRVVGEGPANIWTDGGSPDLRSWMTNKVTFDGCRDRDSTYFGGLLAHDPLSCLSLRISQTGFPAELKRLRLNGSPC